MNNNWQTKKIGDVLYKTDTINPTLNPDREFIYIDVSSVSNKTYSIENTAAIRGRNAPSRARKKVKSGDILYATIRPTLKRIAIVPEELNGQVCSTGFFVMRRKETISNLFLFYFLISDLFNEKVSELQRGASYPAINESDFKNISFSFPKTIEEQELITRRLQSADLILRKRKQAIGLLDEYIKSVFLEMFGDPAKNSKNFAIKPLKKILRLPTQNGLYIPKEDYSDVGIEMVHMSDVFGGIVKRGSMKRISVSEKTISKYSITSEDLLIARRSLTYEGSAKPCRIPQSIEPLVFESSLIKVSVDEKQILPVYLYYYLINPIVRETYVLKHVTSSTISGINQSGLNEISILVPPIELQNKFADILFETEKLKEKMLSQLGEIDINFQSLMQKSFSIN